MSGSSNQPAADAVAGMADEWKHVLPDLDTRPLLVLGRLQRIVARSDASLRPAFAAAGLGAGDFDVLAALRRRDPAGPVPAGDLAEAMLVTPGAATKRVDRLAAAGLVTREASESDRRGRSIALTGRGRTLTDRLMNEHMANEATVIAALDDAEQDQLAGLLARILNHIEADNGQEGI
ncbi:MarR family winged helix-turn-helix transcriptional regulator [Spelaeicoccus albus]|uniref:DNA-binding MarR family transcriptional regulator n=1 Tax=Spelaeicoccus albus TaxID=1280376 RepID=A0A7Z0IJG8_9MICO|nr:MarR family transcriptional regulator [Spelaeicoccus albus]NYI69411.1 DNA-binding MarR family transcriptional regulator [Spelaeicoccus albus]